MQTEQHRTPRPGPAGDPDAAAAAQASDASADWQPRNGLMSQMLAYRDWWNMPSRRSPRRAPRQNARPGKPGQA